MENHILHHHQNGGILQNPQKIKTPKKLQHHVNHKKTEAINKILENNREQQKIEAEMKKTIFHCELLKIKCERFCATIQDIATQKIHQGLQSKCLSVRPICLTGH